MTKSPDEQSISPASTQQIPSAPAPAPHGIRALFMVRHGPRRWPAALRSAVCMGAPVLVGWLAGDTTAGFMGALGGFTAAYGNGRPYLNRAIFLAIIAVSLGAAAGLGLWAASISWLGVITVVSIATVATLLCNALAVGPPGAYQFALVCAVGTGMHAEHLSPATTALLVFAGGAFAWLVHMAGAILGPRRPEKSAAAAAGVAVADCVDAVGTPREDAARRRAVQAMHQAWVALVGEQPHHARRSRVIRRLQELISEVQVLFADAMIAASDNTAVDPSASAVARRLAAQAHDPPPELDRGGADRFAIVNPGLFVTVWHAVRPGSRWLLVAVRVAVAALVAGGIGSLLSLDHAYWAIAAAVLVLHQGLDRNRTVQRGLERVVGTLVGLGIAGLVISAALGGLRLVAAVMVLTYAIQFFVARNYTIAVVFITSLALLLATGGRSTADPGALLVARGLDTLVGCAVALAVFLALRPRALTATLPDSVANALDSASAIVAGYGPDVADTARARAARRDLQHKALEVDQTYDDAVNGTADERRAAERAWPVIVATQRLVNRILAEFWQFEHLRQRDVPGSPTSSGGDGGGGDGDGDGGDDSAGGAGDDVAGRMAHLDAMRREAARRDAQQYDKQRAARLYAALRALAAAVRDGRKPGPVGEQPGFVDAEVHALRDALVRQPAF